MGIFEERFLGSRRGRNSQQKRQERLSLGDWSILSLNTKLNSDLPVFSIVAHTFPDLIRDNLWEYLFLREEGSKLKKKTYEQKNKKNKYFEFFSTFY